MAWLQAIGIGLAVWDTLNSSGSTPSTKQQYRDSIRQQRKSLWSSYKNRVANLSPTLHNEITEGDKYRDRYFQALDRFQEIDQGENAALIEGRGSNEKVDRSHSDYHR